MVVQVGDFEAQDLHPNTEAGDKTYYRKMLCSHKSSKLSPSLSPFTQVPMATLWAWDSEFFSPPEATRTLGRSLSEWGTQKAGSQLRLPKLNAEKGRRCRSLLLSSADWVHVQTVFGSGDWGPLSRLAFRCGVKGVNQKGCLPVFPLEIPPPGYPFSGPLSHL